MGGLTRLLLRKTQPCVFVVALHVHGDSRRSKNPPIPFFFSPLYIFLRVNEPWSGKISILPPREVGNRVLSFFETGLDSKGKECVLCNTPFIYFWPTPPPPPPDVISLSTHADAHIIKRGGGGRRSFLLLLPLKVFWLEEGDLNGAPNWSRAEAF